MKNLLRNFLANESGAMAIEYTLIASIVSIAIAGTLYEIGGKVEQNFAKTSAAFNK